MRQPETVSVARRRELCEQQIEVNAGGAIRMARISGALNKYATLSWPEKLEGGTSPVELQWAFAWHVVEWCLKNHERPTVS